jgi:hypothetical protein
MHQWKEFFHVSNCPKTISRLFDPDRVLFGSFPVALGGAGWHETTRFEDDFFLDLLFLRLSRAKAEYAEWEEFESEKVPSEFQEMAGTLKTVEAKRKPTGWYKKESVKEWTSVKYGEKKNKIRWNQPVSITLPVAVRQKLAEEQLQFLTSIEKQELVDEYQQYWYFEKMGYRLVEKPHDPFDILGSPLKEEIGIERKIQL